MKICYKCKEKQELNQFYKCVKHNDGLQKICKTCKKKFDKTYLINNKKKHNKLTKEWRNKNQEYFHNYYINNKEQFQEWGKEYYINNKEQFQEWGKEYYINNKEYCLKLMKLNQDKIKNDPIKYKEQRIKSRIYCKEYYKNNVHKFILRNQIRQIRYVLNTIKNEKLNKILNYTPLQFKQHIELQFESWMNWENIGKWHIDHKIPITWFKQQTPFNIVNNLNNLQPKSKKYNLKKSNSFSDIINKEYYDICIGYIIEDKIKQIIHNND